MLTTHNHACLDRQPVECSGEVWIRYGQQLVCLVPKTKREIHLSWHLLVYASTATHAANASQKYTLVVIWGVDMTTRNAVPVSTLTEQSWYVISVSSFPGLGVSAAQFLSTLTLNAVCACRLQLVAYTTRYVPCRLQVAAYTTRYVPCRLQVAAYTTRYVPFCLQLVAYPTRYAPCRLQLVAYIYYTLCAMSSSASGLYILHAMCHVVFS